MFDQFDKSNPEELWHASEVSELTAFNVLAEQLKSFDLPIKKVYAAGVQAPTLPGKRTQELDLMFAALFLKKALNDLRSAWLLLRVGYTSQSAAVVASLYENALTVSCLAGQEKNVRKLQNNKSGDLPWSPIKLAKNLASQWRDDNQIQGKKFDNDDYELAWREIYSGYKWLCKIKHPTMGSALHDALSTMVKAGEFVVMAAPDIRSEDLVVKATIIMIAISRVREAIRSFVLAMEVDTTSSEYEFFVERMVQVLELTMEAFDEAVEEPPPFTVTDQKLQKEWRRLKSKNKPDNA